jgi:peroxiredoxin
VLVTDDINDRNQLLLASYNSSNTPGCTSTSTPGLLQHDDERQEAAEDREDDNDNDNDNSDSDEIAQVQ